MHKKAIVTGANTGLGYEVVKELVKHNYHVIMGCRDLKRGYLAMDKIILDYPEARIECMQLDMVDRPTIKRFVDDVLLKFSEIDLVVNNAGVMIPPRTITQNGEELQLDTNQHGHFYLNYLLKDNLRKKAKIVIVSSLAHKNKRANIYYDDITFKKNYNPFVAYCQSKYANALYGMKLVEKLPNTKIIIAHPGVSDTELSRYMPSYLMFLRPLVKLFMPISNPSEGAESIVYACLEDLPSGTYVGPQGKDGWKGKPGITKLSDQALDKKNQDDFWQYECTLLDIKW